MSEKRYKFIPTPEKCDLCNSPFKKVKGEQFVDGATRMGPWGCLCMRCFRLHGIGLGLGKGQQYEYDPDGDGFFKVAG